MHENRYHIEETAENDANADTNKIVWVVVGIALNAAGILIAYIYQPAPAASRFLEKSQQYIAFYTDAYRAKTRSIQLTYAGIGFIILALLSIFYIIFIFSYIRNLHEIPRQPPAEIFDDR